MTSEPLGEVRVERYHVGIIEQHTILQMGAPCIASSVRRVRAILESSIGFGMFWISFGTSAVWLETRRGWIATDARSMNHAGFDDIVEHLLSGVCVRREFCADACIDVRGCFRLVAGM